MNKFFNFAIITSLLPCAMLHAQFKYWAGIPDAMDYDGPEDNTLLTHTEHYRKQILETTLGELALKAHVIGVGRVVATEGGAFTIKIEHAVAGCTNGATFTIYQNEYDYEDYFQDFFMPTNQNRIVFAAFIKASQRLQGDQYWDWVTKSIVSNKPDDILVLRHRNRSWWPLERDNGVLFTQFTNVLQAIRFDPNWTNHFELCRDGAFSKSNRVREDSFWDMRKIIENATREQEHYINADNLVDKKNKSFLFSDDWQDRKIMEIKEIGGWVYHYELGKYVFMNFNSIQLLSDFQTNETITVNMAPIPLELLVNNKRYSRREYNFDDLVSLKKEEALSLIRSDLETAGLKLREKVAVDGMPSPVSLPEHKKHMGKTNKKNAKQLGNLLKGTCVFDFGTEDKSILIKYITCGDYGKWVQPEGYWPLPGETYLAWLASAMREAFQKHYQGPPVIIGFIVDPMIDNYDERVEFMNLKKTDEPFEVGRLRKKYAIQYTEEHALEKGRENIRLQVAHFLDYLKKEGVGLADDYKPFVLEQKPPLIFEERIQTYIDTFADEKFKALLFGGEQ